MGDELLFDYTLTGEAVTDGYYFRVAGDATPTAANTLTAGGYLLPMVEPFATEADMTASALGLTDIAYVSDYTLRVVLYDAMGRELLVKKVRVDVDKTHPEGFDEYRYPLLVNHFYSLGVPTAPVDFDQNYEDPEADVIMVVGAWQADVNYKFE